jgi:hypothetical protein
LDNKGLEFLFQNLKLGFHSTAISNLHLADLGIDKYNHTVLWSWEFPEMDMAPSHSSTRSLKKILVTLSHNCSVTKAFPAVFLTGFKLMRVQFIGYRNNTSFSVWEGITYTITIYY